MFFQAFRAWRNLIFGRRYSVASVLCGDAQDNQDLSSNTRQHLETSAIHSTRTHTTAIKYKHSKSEDY